MSKRLYVNIAERIMADILIAGLEPGTKLKSVREYALEYKVNAKTVQRAFDYLDSIKIFYSIVGEGRYLAKESDVIERIKNQLIDAEAQIFVEKMKSYNLSLDAITEIVKENYERSN